MIQLREDDFLWKCYKRYYHPSMAQPPAPLSICNFWWKAVGGMFKWLFWDSPFLFIGILSVILTGVTIWGCVELDAIKSPFPYGIPFVLLIALTGGWTLFLFIFRWIEFWKPKPHGESINAVSGIVSMVLAFSLLFSMMMKDILDKGGSWHIIYLFYGFLVVAGICGVLATIIGGCYFFFTDNTTTGKVIRAYAGSFKDRVCPRVLAPWEKEEPNGEDKEEAPRELVREVPREEGVQTLPNSGGTEKGTGEGA